MQKKSSRNPFIGVDVRAFVEGDPYVVKVVAALELWNYVQKGEHGLGIDGIAALAQIGTTKAKDVVAWMRERGWVGEERSFQKRTSYFLTIEKMVQYEAMEILVPKLPLEIQRLLQKDATRLFKKDATRPPKRRVATVRGTPRVPPNIKTIEGIEKRHKKADADHAYTEDFTIGWEAYGKKGSKWEAFLKWQKLGSGGGPDPDLLIKILEAIDWQSKTEQWNKEGGKFRKDFSGWLSGRRWEMEKPANFKPYTPDVPTGGPTVDKVKL